MMKTREIWLLVIAHPDDESMFFLPTLRNLIQRKQNNVHILCLSNGDYVRKSDGPIRTSEIKRAAAIIGLEDSPSNDKKDKLAGEYSSAVKVIDDYRMKDGPEISWDHDVIAQKLLDHIQTIVMTLSGTDGISASDRWSYVDRKKLKRGSVSNNESVVHSIDINLVTFDKDGVTKHPNHRDTFRGVQYLLNEKCHVESQIPSRDPSPEDATIRTLLRLRQINTAADGSASHESIDIGVRVFTLKSSNSLYLYVLWPFVDLLSYLMVWLFQSLWQLLYFLLGGTLSSSKSREKGTNSSSEVVQYRIFDPILAWRAMAAHHSQFIWFRRLSVIFSRNTHINDLHELTSDTSLSDYEEDDDLLLPPVTTINEGTASPKFLLTPSQMNLLREHILPPTLHHRPWKRIYSLFRDGDSFVTFQKLVGEWNVKREGHPTILVLKTTKGEILGGYADVPFVRLASVPVGSGVGTCLFQFQDKSNRDNPLENEGNENTAITVYGKDIFTSSKRVVCDATRHIVAFGGGQGGDDDGFGLCLEDGFARGTTSRCDAFENKPLVDAEGGLFDVVEIEVWGFVSGQL